MAAVQTDLDRVVEATIARWCEVAAALSPVIGTRGVAMLFKRSLQLSRLDHPWLAAALCEVADTNDFMALRGVLLQQTPAGALAADGALLQAYFDLLGMLIGPALAERLIGFAHPPASNGPAAKDPAP